MAPGTQLSMQELPSAELAPIVAQAIERSQVDRLDWQVQPVTGIAGSRASAVLDRLPVCLCHHDAFRSNMFARDGVNGKAQTVAVDWSMIGYGRIGEEIGNTTACGLARLDVAGEQAMKMDRITFESY